MMRLRPPPRLLWALLPALVAGACTELAPPTEPNSEAITAEPFPGLSSIPLDPAVATLPVLELPPDLLPGQYGCMERRRAPVAVGMAYQERGGMEYQSRYLPLHALGSMEGVAGGKEFRLRIRQRTLSGAVVAEYLCLVPASREAVGHLLATLWLEESDGGAMASGAAGQPRDEGISGREQTLLGGAITPAGETCRWIWDPMADDYYCEFEPIDVVVPPRDNEKPCDPWIDPYWCDCDASPTATPIGADGAGAGLMSNCPGNGGGRDPGDEPPPQRPREPGGDDPNPGDGGGDPPPNHCREPTAIRPYTLETGNRGGGGGEVDGLAGGFRVASDDCPPYEGSLGFLEELTSFDADTVVHAPPCPPDSAPANLRDLAHHWCVARPLTPQQDSVLRIALDRIEARGGICETLAQAGRVLLQREDGIRAFRASDIPLGVKKAGGAGFVEGVVLRDNWFDLLNTTLGFTGWKVNLEFALAHELDHHLHGAGHVYIPEADYPSLSYYSITTNTERCAGVSR